MWIGAASVPSDAVLRRIGEHADGWFALCSPEQYPELRARIDDYAKAAGRAPKDIGAESGLRVPGRSEEEWLGILEARSFFRSPVIPTRSPGGPCMQ